MMNSVNLIGRLVADPEVFYDEEGAKHVSFTLAVQRNKEKSDFIHCVAFSQAASIIENYLKKGDMIGATGSISAGSYKNNIGETKYYNDVIVLQVSLLPNAKQQQQAPDVKKQEILRTEADEEDYDLPF